MRHRHLLQMLALCSNVLSGIAPKSGGSVEIGGAIDATTQLGAEWQRRMSGGQFVRIEPFTGLCSFVKAG
jgi:hypothetical protein